MSTFVLLTNTRFLKIISFVLGCFDVATGSVSSGSLFLLSDIFGYGCKCSDRLMFFVTGVPHLLFCLVGSIVFFWVCYLQKVEYAGKKHTDEQDLV